MYSVWADLAEMGEWGEDLVEARIDHYDIALKSFKFKQPVNPTVLSDDSLKVFKVPSLYLIGENETMYDAHEAISRLNRLNPQIRTVMINGTGHDLMFTHTDTFNHVIIDFLQE